MIRKETEIKNVETVKDILCNKCGNSCKVGTHGSFEFASLQVNWGYYSTRDMEVHEAHLCEQCWEDIVATFKYEDLISENVL